jgi:hypothetical protein
MWRRIAPTGVAPSMGGRRGLPGYTINQQKRKRVEKIFGWAETVGLFRQTSLVRPSGRAEICSGSGT